MKYISEYYTEKIEIYNKGLIRMTYQMTNVWKISTLEHCKILTLACLMIILHSLTRCLLIYYAAVLNLVCYQKKHVDYCNQLINHGPGNQAKFENLQRY